MGVGLGQHVLDLSLRVAPCVFGEAWCFFGSWRCMAGWSCRCFSMSATQASLVKFDVWRLGKVHLLRLRFPNGLFFLIPLLVQARHSRRANHGVNC